MKKRILAVLLIFSMLQMMGTGLGDVVMKKAEAAEKTLGRSDGFLLADQDRQATVYVDVGHEEQSSSGKNSYCGIQLVAETFADDVERVTGKRTPIQSESANLSGDVVIAGTLGHNEVIDKLVKKKSIDVSGLYKDGKEKWDCYQMQFVNKDALKDAGYDKIERALVIAGSNKRGAMYGLFHISEHIGVTPWVYMADAVPEKYDRVCLDSSLLEFNKSDCFLSKEPSVKYRGFFINDESPSFTGWANTKFKGLNENCYQNIFELLIRMKANYLWPAMWGNSFSDEGKKFKLANVVMADAYGICMGTSHHEACYRAGVEWQRIYKNYGTSNEWNYDKNGDAIYKFWEDGVKRNGKYEGTITMGMRGEGDSALSGGVQENIDRLKKIISDQNEIIDNYIKENPDAKAKDSPKIYIPYSENEEYYYGPDDGSIKGLNVWEGMEDVTIMLTDDNYGNVRSLPEESIRNRKAGFGLYYHLDGHVGTGAYEWVSSTQLEHIWDQLTMAYDYNVRNIWVVNVGDVKPLEMELNYAMDLAYDMDKWGQHNTAKTYREKWLQQQLGGKDHCSDEVAEGVADCVADFLKISTYRKPEFVKSTLYSIENYNEAQRVLDLCKETMEEANRYYEKFRGTDWDDAYYQIVYYQAVGTANVTRMQIYKSLSDFYAEQKSSLANIYADMVENCVTYDKELTNYYNNKMSRGKWKKMMSSPHVGFVTWDSNGWKYPEGTSITMEKGSKMLVSPDGDKNAYSEGTAKLPVFTDTEKQRYCVTMSNGASEEYHYTVDSEDDWIQITDKSGEKKVTGGTVENADYFYVSVDWDKVSEEKSGTITITGNDQTVKLTVTAVKTDFDGKGEKIHVESNDVVVMEGDEYADSVAADGVSWKRIDGYGRYHCAMKMFPTTVSFAKPTGKTSKVKMGNVTRTVTEFEDNKNAPYLEYKFYVDEDADYTFTLYTTPTNNIFKPSDWGYVPVDLYYGISVDGNKMQHVNSLPDGKYISYAADGDNRWKDGIMNNIHVSESKENLKKGVHTVRIYGMHAGLSVERLAISNKKLQTSYLGPDRTFFQREEGQQAGQKTGIHHEVFAVEKDELPPPVETEQPTPTPMPTPTAVPASETSVPTAEPTAPSAPNGDSGKADLSTKKNKVVKGKIYTYKGNCYKVTKVTKSGGRVTFMSPVKKNIKKIVIPAQIKLKGKKFSVTAIHKKAFKKCKKLKKVKTTKQLAKKYKKLIEKSIH